MAQTLGQAYKGYGDARRDWMEKERRVETVKGGLEFGADVAFAASSELAAAEKTNQEFETSQKILGDDVQEIDLDTGEAWKERSILGRGDSVSYLNPFEWGGERGLRAGDTLYSEADVSGISQSEDFLTLRAGNEKELANYRENIKSVYGKDVKETDWWKKEQADIKSSAEKRDKNIRIEAAGAEAGYEARKLKKVEHTEARKLKDWAKENPIPATVTAVGTGLAAKKFGPGLVERFKGMSGPGGPPAGGGWAPGGKAATFLRGASPAFAGQLAGAGLGMLGMDEKTAGLAGAGVGAGLTARHMQRTLQPLYSIGVKDALSKDLIKGGKAAIIKNAKALGVSKKAISSLEKGTKGSQTVVKNAIKKKVTDTSSKALLKTGISSSLKTGAKFAGQQAIKKAGLIGAGPIGWMIGAGWTAYDIYKLLNPPKPKRAKYL